MNSEPENAQAAPDVNLAAAAAAIDAEAAAAGAELGAPGAPAPAPADWPAEARMMIGFVCKAIIPIWPRLGAVYTDQVQAELAAAAAPLMQKYDFDLARLLGKFAPEIGFAMVAVPLVIPTVEAIKADRAAARAAAGKPAAAGENAPPASALHELA